MPDTISLDAYFADNGGNLGFPADHVVTERNYQFSMNAARAALQGGHLLQELANKLIEAAQSYSGGRPDLLYSGTNAHELQIFTKPYKSVVSKVYRTNYVNNKKYPSPPSSGWVTYNEIYTRLNDLLRTRLICRYLDGPKFVAEHIEEFCVERGLQYNVYSMETELGYHAWHCYIAFPLTALIDGNAQDVAINLEIQLTTQLAEVIGSLTHGLYENKRETVVRRKDNSWRWQPQSQEFRSAYLGHTLHLLEGVIQTFKDDVLSSKAEPSPSEEAGLTVAAESDPVAKVEGN